MVTPLASAFSPPIVPSVSSALVENLINNNPTPVASSTTPANIITNAQQADVQVVTTTTEANANILDQPLTNQMFTQNPSQAFINSEQHQTITPEQTTATPVVASQTYTNAEGKQYIVRYS
jgi:hypothetical protein